MSDVVASAALRQPWVVADDEELDLPSEHVYVAALDVLRDFSCLVEVGDPR